MEVSMKLKSFAVYALSAALVVTPVAASAHEHHHEGLALGIVVGTAAVAGAILAAPFVALNSAVQPAPVAYYAPAPGYYAPPPPYGYAQPQAYYYPPSAYGYYAQAPVYYAPRYYVAR
jgi:hypothetical protein